MVDVWAWASPPGDPAPTGHPGDSVQDRCEIFSHLPKTEKQAPKQKVSAVAPAHFRGFLSWAAPQRLETVLIP